MSWITRLARPEICALQSYEHAAWEPALERLHANELPWRIASDASAAGLNRYPEPQPRKLIAALAQLYDVAIAQVLAGRGSDEMIDLLVRTFCRAGRDRILICPPTFGMYQVSAHIQGAGVVTVATRAADGFAIDAAALLDAIDPGVRLVFVCSPNNPTGNVLDQEVLLHLARRLNGRALLVIDEAYIEFARTPSLAAQLSQYPHLVILRTLSKAHGLAGARCGAVLADPEIIRLLKGVIPPYAVPQLTVDAVLRGLAPCELASMRQRIAQLCDERARLMAELAQLENVLKVWPSEANFMLVEFADAQRALEQARSAGLLLRDVRSQPQLSQALRISIGTPEQNGRLLEALA